jgi:hypothetical protein
MTLFRFGFSRIIFDKTAIQALGYCFFQYGEVTGINGNNSALTFTTTPFFANNFMMGMKSFHVNGLFRFRFATSIGTTTTIGGTDAYIYLKFMYWSFKLRACPVGYPYFDPILLICYDVCQNGFYGDLATAQCLKCLYSCTTCSSYSVCTNCNPVTNRYLNGSSCLPNPGYFDNQTANAVLCTVVLSQCL